MSKFEDRQVVLEKIKNGVYSTKTSSNLGVALFIVMTLFAFVIFFSTIVAMIVNSALSSNKSSAAVLGTTIVFIIIVAITMIFIIVPKLGKSSKTSRKDISLIETGTELEVHIENSYKTNSGYQLECTSDKYPGMVFKSKLLQEEPIIDKDRKTRVFIDPQNPNNYFVDIYSVLPRQAGPVLMDRSELKHETNVNITANNFAIVRIFLFIFLAPFFITGAGTAIGGLLTGHFITAIFSAFIIFVFATIINKIGNGDSEAKAMLAQGYYLEATGTRYWVTTSDDSTTHHLSCRYIVPGTHDAYNFYTTAVDARAKILVGAKVRVYVNPDKMSVYLIDAKYSLSNFGFTAKQETDEA